jgi:hypothetical protein
MNIDALVQNLVIARDASKEALEANDIDRWLDLISEEFRAADKLREELIRQPSVIANSPEAMQLLKDIDIHEFSDPDRLGMELLWGSISPAEYISALAMVDVLITRFNIPDGLSQFLAEARECFALGQYSAVQSLSRTILEAAVNDIAVRTGKIPADAIEKDMFTEYPPKKRIRLVSGSSFDAVYNHYRDLCKVVHGLSTTSTQGPLQALTKTIGFAEALYHQNTHTIQENENG